MQTAIAQSPSATIAQRCGRWLFRHRSYTLVPLAIFVVAAAWLDPRPPAGPGIWELLLQVAAIGLLLLGETIRLDVAGRAERGTSGRGKRLQAPTLVTTGMYARTRNPLYLGNLILWAGAALLTLNPVVLLVVFVVVGVQYHLIILAEEQFLLGCFGEQYREFCRVVPRVVPRIFSQPTTRGPNAPAVPFDWTRGIFREHDTIFLVFLGGWGILGLSLGLIGPDTGPHAPVGWYAMPVVATLFWLVTKGIKKSR